MSEPVCNLSTPHSTYEDGYEIATFEVNVSTIRRLMELEEGPAYSFLAHLYLGVIPVHPDYDIAKVKTVRMENSSQYKITLKIRRGWWFLREFMLTHSRVETERYGDVFELRCTNCRTQEFYPVDAFPMIEDSCVEDKQT